jgi:hypothetical protein
MDTVVFRGSKDEFRDLLRQLVAATSSDGPDPAGLVRGLQLRLGIAFLSQVQQDFLRKSRGMVGTDGILWPPLKPETIARRRITAAEKREAGIGGRRTLGKLTSEEEAEWKRIYDARLIQLRKSFEEKSARSKAAEFASWAIKKKRGGKTKLEIFGSRKVDILRDTSELFRSFSPGIEDQPSGADGQIFRTEPGAIIVGTNKKPWHHHGVKGKLPARPFWPTNGEIPAAWMPALRIAMATGLARIVTAIARHGGMR